MNVLNTVMDLVMAPLRQLPPELALAGFSVVTGIVILLLFKVSSDPAKIAAARDRALSRVLELWLYREDAAGGLFSVGRAMLNSFGYLATMLKPALVSMLPMLVMLIQANAWFGAKPLQEGDVVLLTVRATRSGVVEALRLEESHSVSNEVSVTSTARNEKSWRLRVRDAEGSSALRISGGGVDESKLLTIGNKLARVSTLRTARRGEHLLYPDEPRLAEPLESIRIAYPPALYTVFGIEMPWIVFLLAVSLITGLILKKPLGVEF